MGKREAGPGAPRLRVLRREPRLHIVHHSDERGSWATAGRRILFQSDAMGEWQELSSFPRRSPLDALGGLRPACRALRLDRCNVFPTRDGALLGIRSGTLYRIQGNSFVPLCRIRGDSVMNRAIAETSDGSLYFGEYFSNADRLPVRIWRLDPALTRAEVAYEFETPRIRHVHAVHCDPFVSGRLWFTSGDRRGECFIGYSDDGFSSVELIGDGDQRFRAVGLIFDEREVHWLTDSHIARNHVVSMDRETRAITLRGEVESSSWYAVRTSDGALLATTTVEPGPAIATRQASLLTSRDARAWSPAASFEKDAWPMRFFKFGSLSLPSGSYSSRAFWLSGEGLEGLDGASLLCSLDPHGGLDA